MADVSRVLDCARSAVDLAPPRGRCRPACCAAWVPCRGGWGTIPWDAEASRSRTGTASFSEIVYAHMSILTRLGKFQ
eukprot:1626494-Prymnesium_polylepis.2